MWNRAETLEEMHIWPVSACFFLFGGCIETLVVMARMEQKSKKKTISWKTFRFHWSNCWGLEGPSATSWLPKAPKTCGLLRTCGKQKWSVTTSSAGCAGTQEHRHHAAYSKQYRTASCYNPKHVEASASQPSCSLFGSIHTASWKISKDMLLMSTPRNQRIYH